MVMLLPSETISMDSATSPILDVGIAYAHISAGLAHTVLLRSDGSAVAIGNNQFGQCNIPRLDEGIKYTQISAGIGHTVLLRSDGSAVAIGANRGGQCNIPPLAEGMTYTQISAGFHHTVLLRSDGFAVAVGSNGFAQCNIPRLDEDLVYTRISAGIGHTVLLCSEGRALAIGKNVDGQCSIPWPLAGICYIDDVACDRDLALQLELVQITLICSTLAGQECCRLIARGVDSACELNVNLLKTPWGRVQGRQDPVWRFGLLQTKWSKSQ
jgi:hypothetical protein